MRAARQCQPRIDVGDAIILLGSSSLLAVVVLYMAGYPVPGPLIAVLLSLCPIVALVIGFRFARRSKEDRR